MIRLTEDEFKALFAPYPSVRKGGAGTPICPYCENAFGPESLDYYNGATEAGTPFCNIEITCDICGKEIWKGGSWYPGIEVTDELIEVVGELLAEEIRGE